MLYFRSSLPISFLEPHYVMVSKKESKGGVKVVFEGSIRTQSRARNAIWKSLFSYLGRYPILDSMPKIQSLLLDLGPYSLARLVKPSSGADKNAFHLRLKRLRNHNLWSTPEWYGQQMENSLPWLYKYPDTHSFSKLGYSKQALFYIIIYS